MLGVTIFSKFNLENFSKLTKVKTRLDLGFIHVVSRKNIKQLLPSDETPYWNSSMYPLAKLALKLWGTMTPQGNKWGWLETPKLQQLWGFSAGAIKVQSDKNQSENFMRFLPIHALTCLYVRSLGSTWELCWRTSCPLEVHKVRPTDQAPPQLPRQVALSCSEWGD